MMIEEFESLTKIYPSSKLYSAIEAEYMNGSYENKDEFCKAYKSNKGGVAERIKRVANEADWKADKAIANAKKELAEQQKAYEEKLRRLNMNVLDPNSVEMLKRLLVEKTSVLQREVSNAAERIVETAEDPSSVAFRSAVNDHRIAAHELEQYTATLRRLCEVSDTSGK